MWHRRCYSCLAVNMSRRNLARPAGFALCENPVVVASNQHSVRSSGYATVYPFDSSFSSPIDKRQASAQFLRPVASLLSL